MSFTNIAKESMMLPGGLVIETGTWSGASVTSGEITAQTTIQPEIFEIVMWGASNDEDNAVICATDAGQNILKLTFTSDDTGTYYIVGKGR